MEWSDDDVHSGAAASAGGVGDRRQLMTSGDVADLFGVDPKTVARWADAGKLRALRTLGGHRRYRHDEVLGLFEALGGGVRAS